MLYTINVYDSIGVHITAASPSGSLPTALALLFQHSSGATVQHELPAGDGGLVHDFDGIGFLGAAGTYTYSVVMTVGSDTYTVAALTADGTARTVQVIAGPVDLHGTAPDPSEHSYRTIMHLGHTTLQSGRGAVVLGH